MMMRMSNHVNNNRKQILGNILLKKILYQNTRDYVFFIPINDYFRNKCILELKQY